MALSLEVQQIPCQEGPTINHCQEENRQTMDDSYEKQYTLRMTRFVSTQIWDFPRTTEFREQSVSNLLQPSNHPTGYPIPPRIYFPRSTFPLL